ncbi:MAG: MFS transporter [Ectothiorhodospiraceae bacterium]|nr:MFS transporter [Ectothiorhodospiraceae bacterium]
MNGLSRNVALLAACQALLLTNSSLIATTSALAGLALAPAAELATVPLGVQFLCMMSTTYPASMLMRRIGRRAGFAIGAAVGIGGATTCALGLVAGSFAAFAVGSGLLGVFTGVGQYYRFAAADAAPEGARARAISLVMAGGLVAAFLGPNLANLTRDLLQPATYAGCYASLVGLQVLTMALLAFVTIPPPGAEERGPGGRPLGAIALDSRFVVAVLGAVIGYGTMNLLMTATPLAMRVHGYPFGDTAFVIQWHVVGMFAPSFVTGSLITRHGEGRVMAAGALALIGCVAVNLAGESVGSFWLALVLLGVGWNFLFVGATSLLTTVYLPVEKAKTQGLNDLLVFGTVAATAFSSGMLHHRLGWHGLNLAVLPALVLALLGAVMLARARRPTRP